MNSQQQITAEGDSDFDPVNPLLQEESDVQHQAEEVQPGQQEEQPQRPVTQQVVHKAVSPALAPVRQEVPIALEHALIRTLAMLQQHNLASAEDCSQVAAAVRRNWEAGKGADPIDCLARLRSGGGDMLDASVEMISVKLAHSMAIVPPRVDFASRLIPPTSLYEKSPQIALFCKLMLVPVTFAEDQDVIGVASINPYFADALVHIISEEVKKEIGVQPIMNIVRIGYINWMKMCRKHFKEEGES